jgi:hypothetical protein
MVNVFTTDEAAFLEGVAAYKGQKQIKERINSLLPEADSLSLATSFLRKTSRDIMKKLLRDQGFENRIAEVLTRGGFNKIAPDDLPKVVEKFPLPQETVDYVLSGESDGDRSLTQKDRAQVVQLAGKAAAGNDIATLHRLVDVALLVNYVPVSSASEQVRKQDLTARLEKLLQAAPDRMKTDFGRSMLQKLSRGGSSEKFRASVNAISAASRDRAA